jgi:hypothetical protein
MENVSANAVRGEIKMTEENYAILCGLIMGIIGVSIMIFQYFYYLLGIPRTIDDTLTGLLMGFILAQLGIDFMLISWIRKVQMEGKRR